MPFSNRGRWRRFQQSDKLGIKGLTALTAVTVIVLLLSAIPSPEVVITGGRVHASADTVVIGTNLQNPGMLPAWTTLSIELRDTSGALLLKGSESGWIPAGETVFIVLAFEYPNIAVEFYELVLTVS